MPVIAKISVQKNNPQRYHIYFAKGNGEEYAFSVDENVLIKFRLKKGMELDDFLLTEITDYEAVSKAYQQAVQFLAKRKRTEAEVRNYLREKEVPEFAIQEAIHKLYEYKFLDDEDYAFSYVRTQMNTSDKGPELIMRELQQRGVGAILIEKALMEYPYEKQFEAALALCEKMAAKNNRDSRMVLKQKMEQLLLRKGYPYDMISSVIDEIFENKPETEGEMEAIRYQGEKARRKFSSLEPSQFKLKMKENLYRKGFSLDLIEQYLSELEEEE